MSSPAKPALAGHMSLTTCHFYPQSRENLREAPRFFLSTGHMQQEGCLLKAVVSLSSTPSPPSYAQWLNELKQAGMQTKQFEQKWSLLKEEWTLVPWDT